MFNFILFILLLITVAICLSLPLKIEGVRKDKRKTHNPTKRFSTQYFYRCGDGYERDLCLKTAEIFEDDSRNLMQRSCSLLR